MDLERLARLRRDLVDWQATHRAAGEAELVTRARIEQEAIMDAEAQHPDAKPGTAHGANKEDRERYLVVALARSEDYRRAAENLGRTQEQVAILAAEIEILHDEQRERGDAVREKLADALSENARVRGTFMRTDDLGITG